MSRSQDTSVYNTATDESKVENANAQDSYAKAQSSVSDYQKNLAKFQSQNPYEEGGEFQTDTNQVTANTADSTAKSYGNMLQEQAQRTGENRSGANASAEAIAQQSQRDLGATQASDAASRISNESAYNQAGLAAGTVPISAEEQLASEQQSAASGNLGTAGSAAAANQSFWDQFGGAFAKGLGGTLSGGGGGSGSTGASAAKYLMA